MDYKFVYDEKEYILTKENCEGIFFDDENEVTGLSLDTILSALNDGEEVNFSKNIMLANVLVILKKQINKSYRYLEYHFYIYTKNKEYVINTLSEEYKSTSFNRLFSLGKIDDSYIVNVTVCPNCGTYSIEVDQCTV